MLITGSKSMEFFFNYHKIKTRINCNRIKTHMYFVLTVTGSKPHTFSHRIKTRINCNRIKTHMHFVLTGTGSKPT